MNDKWVNVNTYRNNWCFFFVSSVFLKLNIKAKLTNMERANLHCILFYDWKHIYTKNVLLRTICILNYNHCIIKNPLRKNNFAFVERQSYVLTLFCEKIMEKTHLFECVVRFGGANWSMAKASLSAVLLILFLVLVLDLWKDATSFYLYYISVFSCKYFCLTCKM